VGFGSWSAVSNGITFVFLWLAVARETDTSGGSEGKEDDLGDLMSANIACVSSSAGNDPLFTLPETVHNNATYHVSCLFDNKIIEKCH
jgi:hypothetical protein